MQLHAAVQIHIDKRQAETRLHGFNTHNGCEIKAAV